MLGGQFVRTGVKETLEFITAALKTQCRLLSLAQVRFFPTVMFMLTLSTASYHSLDVILTKEFADKPYGIFVITQYTNLQIYSFEKIDFVSV